MPGAYTMENIFPTDELSMTDCYTPAGQWEPHNLNANSFFDNICMEPFALDDSNQSNQSTRQYDDSINYRENIPSPLSSKDPDLDPFSQNCRIPLPDDTPMSGYQLWLESSFMCKRNERERQRVRNVNDGFSRLRNHLPPHAPLRRRQSKVEVLRDAISYIKKLQKLVDGKQDRKK